MRRHTAAGRCRAKRRSLVWLAAALLLAGALHINRYVNTVIKPTLHELAEYEARAAAVQRRQRSLLPYRLRWTPCRRFPTVYPSAV